MTVYLRLLAGFTSFMSKRCLSHFFSIGPVGILARSSMLAFSDYFTRPAITAIGMEMLPTAIRMAKIQAAVWAMRM